MLTALHAGPRLYFLLCARWHCMQDLTQLTFGISRDDAQAKFLTFYKQHGLLPSDPFESIDEIGVGEMVGLQINFFVALHF